ncbi:chaplin [Streptomyces albofaciens JCM 4342]|uniref:chaplin n=1 Tax=Streptomyces albofaciens TaxID=66866 RepID=UPI00123B59DB|nr:chaplin [Streptomyces albofaciens]KAA6222830.1 chaplin [Streptomyces albofaciens JCM 4342]
MRQVGKKGLITIAAASGVLAVASGYAHADSGAQGNAAHSPGVLGGNAGQLPVDIPVQACGNSANVVGLLNPAMGNGCADGGGSRGGAHGGRGHGGNGQGGAGAQGSAQGSPGTVSGNHVQAPVHAPVNACGNSVNVVGLGNPVNANGCAADGSSTGDGTGTGTDRPAPHHPGPRGPQPSGDGPRNPDSPATTPAEERAGEPATPSERQAPHTTDTAGAVQERGPRAQLEESTPHTQIVTPPKGDHGEGEGEEEGNLAQTGSSALGVALPASAGLLIGGAVLYRRARSARR